MAHARIHEFFFFVFSSLHYLACCFNPKEFHLGSLPTPATTFYFSNFKKLANLCRTPRDISAI
jgi:hypothetical protein